MTLRDLFSYADQQPGVVALLLLTVPLLTYLVNLWSGETAESIWGWRYVYAALVYAACIPGVFALTLNVYLFLFERQSIWAMNLVLQLLPVLTMGLTLWLVQRKLPFTYVPGFGRLSGFLTLIAALIGLMWFVDRLHLVTFTYVPFTYLLIGFIGMLLLIRFAWSRLF